MALSKDLGNTIKEELLICKICLENLTNPKSLPCLHTFCESCIGYYMERHRTSDQRKFACPICRRPVFVPKNGVEGFPDCFFVTNLSDIIVQTTLENVCRICNLQQVNKKADQMCVECCISMCTDCADLHLGTPMMKDHTMLYLHNEDGTVQNKRQNSCKTHRGEQVKYYCETCNQCICVACTLLDHRSHTLGEIKHVLQTSTHNLHSLLSASRDSISTLTTTKSDLADVQSELTDRMEMVKLDIRRSVQAIIAAINEQETQLLRELDEVYDTTSTSRDHLRVVRAIEKLQLAHDYATSMVSKETSPLTLLQNKKDAKSGLEMALRFEAPDITQHIEKLEHRTHFIPGRFNINLGHLMFCTVHDDQSVQDLRKQTHIKPTATYITKLTNTHGEPFTIAPKGETSKPFAKVGHLAILPGGQVAVLTSLESCRVHIFNDQGSLSHQFGSDTDLPNPTDMCVTPQGQLAITELTSKLVKVFTPQGDSVLEFGGGDKCPFEFLAAIACNEHGQFYVFDMYGVHLSIHSAQGEVLAVTTLEECVPCSLVCWYPLLFTASENQVSIYRENSEREIQHVANYKEHPDTQEPFTKCSTLCLNSSGDLYLRDNSQDKLCRFNLKGEMSCIDTTDCEGFTEVISMAMDGDSALVVIQSQSQPDHTGAMYSICKYKLG